MSDAEMANLRCERHRDGVPQMEREEEEEREDEEEERSGGRERKENNSTRLREHTYNSSA